MQVPVMAPGSGWDCHAHIFDGDRGNGHGHYRPPTRTLAMLEHAGRGLGIGHVVLVQPSVYGIDNRLLVDALRESGGRHRGVAVVAADVDDGTLHEMHDSGVRGVRFNLVSPVGNGGQAFVALAPRLRALGWHVQWYATPANLATIADLHDRHDVRCVLDHLGGFTRAAADDSASWRDLRRLADLGAWLKLSGWYRLGAVPPYTELHDVVIRAAEAFGQQCIWGSDWPHTRFLEPANTEPAPGYDDTWHPVVRALGAARAGRILNDFPVALYG